MCIMSLCDGVKKMFKFDFLDMMCINLIDDVDVIMFKIKKVIIDLLLVFESKEGLVGRVEVENFVGIYVVVSECSVEDVLVEFGGKGFGVFKLVLVEILVVKFFLIVVEMCCFIVDCVVLDVILKDGVEKVCVVVALIMVEVCDVVGFWCV